MAREQMPWGWRYDLREWVAEATQSPAHLLSFVLCTIMVLVIALTFTSAIFGWPYSDLPRDCNIDFPCP